MRKEPIHQNLSTTFVNVGALVRYLRGLGFVGSIRIELASYEAEIIFMESKTVRAREYDHIAGRISHGKQALNRILVRSKEPNGRIHVYKNAEGYSAQGDGSIFVDKTIMNGARKMAGSPGGSAGNALPKKFVLTGRKREDVLVLATLSELLREIEASLSAGKLSFADAFRVACFGIAKEFPFLLESREALVYENGEIKVRVRADTDLVTAAVFAALHPIFRRLRSELKYRELYRVVSDRLRELAAQRRDEFAQLGLGAHIEGLLANE